MLMTISQSDQFIKVREYLKACDALGFLYRIDAFGQVCLDEGKDWSAFRTVWNKFEHPSAKVLKAVLASMGRVDKPFEAPEGPFISIDPMTGLVIGELEGAAV
jgi:hypothetical protein